MDTDSLAKFKRFQPDEMMELYKNDPVLFDELAAELISQACIGKTEQDSLRLRQIQWTIDGQLRKGKTPLQRMQIMENIFYSRIYGEDGELARLTQCWNDLIQNLMPLEKKPANKTLRLLKERENHQNVPYVSAGSEPSTS